MKFQRTDKGVTIELDDEECETLKRALGIYKSYININEVVNAIHSELDAYLGENNE